MEKQGKFFILKYKKSYLCNRFMCITIYYLSY